MQGKMLKQKVTSSLIYLHVILRLTISQITAFDPVKSSAKLTQPQTFRVHNFFPFCLRDHFCLVAHVRIPVRLVTHFLFLP